MTDERMHPVIEQMINQLRTEYPDIPLNFWRHTGTKKENGKTILVMETIPHTKLPDGTFIVGREGIND